MGFRKRVSDRLYQLGPGRYYQPTYRRIAEAVGLQRGAFLDLGCGPGWLCVHMAKQQPNVNAFGIDHSPQMVEAAQRNAADHSNVVVRHMHGRDLEFDDNTFDAVTAIQTAHHWRETDEIVAEAFRVLKPGGSLFIYEADKEQTTVPDGWIEQSWGWPPDAMVLSGWRRFGMNDDEWFALEACVRRVDFQRVVLDRHGFYRRMVGQK